jgi:hypothetical protein
MKSAYTHDTPDEPELGENQFIDRDGNVQTDNLPENLENIDRENPFNI